MAFQVGCDEVSSLLGDPRGPGDEARVRLSAKGVEGLAKLCCGLRIEFDWGRGYSFSRQWKITTAPYLPKDLIDWKWSSWSRPPRSLGVA